MALVESVSSDKQLGRRRDVVAFFDRVSVMIILPR